MNALPRGAWERSNQQNTSGISQTIFNSRIAYSTPAARHWNRCPARGHLGRWTTSSRCSSGSTCADGKRCSARYPAHARPAGHPNGCCRLVVARSERRFWGPKESAWMAASAASCAGFPAEASVTVPEWSELTLNSVGQDAGPHTRRSAPPPHSTRQIVRRDT